MGGSATSAPFLRLTNGFALGDFGLLNPCLRINMSLHPELFQSSSRAISKQFQSKFRTISEQFQKNFQNISRATIEQLQSSFGAVSEQYFRFIPEELESNGILGR